MGLALGHDLNDFLVGLPHAHGAQAADVADGVFHALGQDPVAAPELLAPAEHLVAQDARVHSGSDFRCAGGLGTVADDAGIDGQGVDQGMGDAAGVAALEVGDAAARAAARADGAAVGGQPADAGF